MPWYTVLTIFITAVISLLLGYQLIIGFFAFFAYRPVGPADRNLRFALVISARNEETVIGHLLDSLAAQAYPRDAYTVFVIADNCTDRTGDVAAAKGATVYSRQDLQKIGKGFALGWFFRQFLPFYRDQYDAVAVFDADNLVDPGFLAEMNRQLCAGQVAAMGYRDSKNPCDNIVSATTAISFWFVARFYDQPRHRLQLMIPAGGTGYVFRIGLLTDGWQTRTISEDMEFTLFLAMKGQRLGYAPEARFYDEQPTNLFVSLRQRFRWAVGCYQNLRIYLPALLGKFKSQPFFLILDTVIFMIIQPGFGLQLLITSVCLAGALLDQPANAWFNLLQPLLYSSLIGLGGMYIQTVLVLALEKKFSWRILPGALLFPAFLVSNALIYLLAAFKRQVTWHPIAHKRDIDLAQINRQ